MTFSLSSQLPNIHCWTERIQPCQSEYIRTVRSDIEHRTYLQRYSYRQKPGDYFKHIRQYKTTPRTSRRLSDTMDSIEGKRALYKYLRHAPRFWLKEDELSGINTHAYTQLYTKGFIPWSKIVRRRAPRKVLPQYHPQRLRSAQALPRAPSRDYYPPAPTDTGLQTEPRPTPRTYDTRKLATKRGGTLRKYTNLLTLRFRSRMGSIPRSRWPMAYRSRYRNHSSARGSRRRCAGTLAWRIYQAEAPGRRFAPSTAYNG